MNHEIKTKRCTFSFVYDIDVEAALMQIWKSPYMFVFI